MRIRETNTSENIAWQGLRRDPPSSTWYNWYSGVSVAKSYHKRVEDVEVPDFHARKKCGEFLPLNPFTVLTDRESFSLGHADGGNYQDGVALTFFKGEVGGNPYTKQNLIDFVDQPDTGLVNAVGNSAITRSASADWDLGTWLGELRDTVHTVKELTRLLTGRSALIANEARLFKRDPWGRFRTLWLASRYGIRPIVYDLQSQFEAIQTLLNVDKRVLFVGRSKVSVSLDKDKFVDSGVNWSPYFKSQEIWRVRGERTYRGLAYAKPTPGNFLGGAVSIDPIVTGWELTRFSFVIDRVIDLGSLLGTIRPMLTQSLQGACTGIKTEFTSSVLTKNVPKGTPPTGQYGMGEWGSGLRSVTREMYQRTPYTVGFPGFNFRLDIPFVIDLVTLGVGSKRRIATILNRR